MKKPKRVHIRCVVNAANVSKAGGVYTIKDVCGAVDDIVMHNMLYPAESLAAGVKSLEGKPAPAGHPKNAAGQNISALNGAALASAWIGSYCTNARHEGGRTLVDILVNEAQAKAHTQGAKLVERLDAAIAGTNADPIHVSTGVLVRYVNTAGESRGKKYDRVAVNLDYDHLAILLNQRGAGTPEEGVGMFLNDSGEEEEVEEVTANSEPEDRRGEGLLAPLKAWLRRLVGNGTTDVSFDQISSGLYTLLPDGAWLQEVFDRYAVWRDRDGKWFRQDYAVSSDGSVAFSSDPQEVKREVSYVPITNSQEVDQVKDQIIAALNAAGISGVAAMTDAQLMESYDALRARPHVEALNAANNKIAGFEANARATEEAEVNALATELAVNSQLTVDDLKKLGLPRLKELKGASKAAPVVVGNSGKAAATNEFEGYSLNSHLEAK